MGWIKRGPTGVIGTNKKDAHETVELLLEDVRAGAAAQPAGTRQRPRSRRWSPSASPTTSRYAGWESIDAARARRWASRRAARG